MSRPHVLRIPRSDDDEGSFVLVHVQPPSSNTSRPLDVKIVATEGTAPYVVTLKHSSIQALKSRGSPCTSEEWEQILESLLLGQDVVPDIHLTAAARSGLEITVRKKVQRITQRLGVINLQEDESEAVELFDWCGLALESTSNARIELASAKAKAEECELAVSELSKQLDELVQAKAEHEAALLEKFRLLLNEKKAKIREQHEVINSRDLDSPTPATSSRPGRKDDRGKAEEDTDRDTKFLANTARRPAAARKPKRKAPAAELSSDSDDGFDAMDVERPKQGEDDRGNSSGEEKQTSDEGDQATASEPEDINATVNDQAKPSGQATTTTAITAASATAAAPAPSPPTTRQASRGKPIATRAHKISPKPSAAYKDYGSETESDDEL